jgi:hypothetical protein
VLRTWAELALPAYLEAWTATDIGIARAVADALSDYAELARTASTSTDRDTDPETDPLPPRAC